MASTSTVPTFTKAGLRTTAYDRVSSWLIALLVLFGIATASLLAAWLANQIRPRQVLVPIDIPDVGGGSPHGVPGESIEIDAPSQDEIGQETDLETPQLQETLAMIVDAAGTQPIDASDPNMSDALESGGASGGSKGDGRAVGLGFGDGEPGIPRAQRWEIVFPEGATLNEYAAQLDHFGIELGVVGVTSDVHYAFRLSKNPPDRREGPASAEKRLYMSWQNGNLKQADRALLTRAGVPIDGRIVVQFYPREVENLLATLEEAYRGLKAAQIRKTIFAVRPSGGGYEFFVMNQIPL